MNQDGSSNKGRRGFQVGGEDSDAARGSKPRTVDEALRLERDEAPELAEGQSAYNPDRVRAFLEGRITLGDLEGITKQEQYQMAEVGYSYFSSGKMAEAKTVFDGLLALDPFDAYFHTVLGSIAQRAEDYDEAEARFTRALEINPYSATAMANRGEIRVMQGRLSEGAQDLINAVQADPQGVEPATVRAQATLRSLREQLQAAADSEDAGAASSRTSASGAPSASPRSAEGASRTPSARPSAGAPGARRPQPRKK